MPFLGVTLLFFVTVFPHASAQSNNQHSVCFSGCDFQSFDEAFAIAKDGDVITVGAGRYPASPMDISKSLSIRGQGMNATILLNSNPEIPFVILEGNRDTKVAFEQITLDGLCNAPTQTCVSDGVMVYGGASLRLNEMGLKNHPGIGLGVHDEAVVNISNTVISNNSTGLILADNAQMSMSFSSLETNLFGIQVMGDGNAQLDITTSSISNNGKGISLLPGEAQETPRATIDIFDSIIGNNGGHGFEGGGAVTIRSSSFLFNAKSGVKFVGAGSLRLFQNRIYINNENGVEFSCEFDTNCVTMNGNEIFRNGIWGVDGQALMVFECLGNDVHDNNLGNFSNSDLQELCS